MNSASRHKFTHFLSHTQAFHLHLSFKHILCRLYHAEYVTAQRNECCRGLCLLQTTVRCGDVAERIARLRLVNVAEIVRTCHYLIVGRIEHEGTFVACEVHSEAVILIADAEQREQRWHHVHLHGEFLHPSVLHAGTEDDERYVIIRLRQLAVHLSYYLAVAAMMTKTVFLYHRQRLARRRKSPTHQSAYSTICVSGSFVLGLNQDGMM